jgi:hypothetical protein
MLMPITPLSNTHTRHPAAIYPYAVSNADADVACGNACVEDAGVALCRIVVLGVGW